MNYQEFGNKGLKWRPRGDSMQHVQYLQIGLFPMPAPSVVEVRSRGEVPSRLGSELAERHKSRSLRQLAREYGMSHEAIRRAIARANTRASDNNPPGNQSS